MFALTSHRVNHWNYPVAGHPSDSFTPGLAIRLNATRNINVSSPLSSMWYSHEKFCSATLHAHHTQPSRSNAIPRTGAALSDSSRPRETVSSARLIRPRTPPPFNSYWMVSSLFKRYAVNKGLKAYGRSGNETVPFRGDQNRLSAPAPARCRSYRPNV